MVEIQNYVSFIGAIITFQLIPGPGTLTILNATARSGIRAGFGAVAGTLLGDFLYMTGAVLGLAAVMHTHPVAFEVLQGLGAVYLCWVGLQWLRSPLCKNNSAPEPKTSRQLYFQQALIVGLTNPKVMVFFIALFPLFLHADASPVTLGVMILHVSIMSFLYQGCLVIVGNAMACKLGSMPSVRGVATRLAGIALIVFGVKLAVNSR